MKKIKYIALIASLIYLWWTIYANFSDIENHQYQESIQYITEQEIVQWYPDGTFKPDQTITRAEITKIIVQAYSSENTKVANECFPDVKQEDRFSPYVCYAKVKWIIQWYPDGNFWADNAVTRAEWLKIALETFQVDINESAWKFRYSPYRDFAHNNNIFSKYNQYPDTPMTRWEMAYLTQQLLFWKKWNRQFDNQRNNASPWCFIAQPNYTPAMSIVNWIQRNYITDVWQKYNHNNPSKLIIAFHGRTNSNEQVQWYYNIDKVREESDIIVYPAWLPAGNARNRSNPWDPSDQLRDFALFDQLVEEFTNNYCVNMDEIYVVWHSLGAWFTNSLACSRGDTIRAIGSVWWSTTINTCTGPVSAIIMHNPKDNLATFAGWERARDQLLSQNWCNPDITIPVWPELWNCQKYTQCLDDTTVVRCPHTQDYGRGSYYPHNRPDFAAQEIRNFFQEHNN